MTYPFLHPYKIDPEHIDVSKAKSIGKKKHLLFAVPEKDMQQALNTFDPFPVELKNFYQEIGFGFFHRKKTKLNTLIDPMSLVNINLRLGYNKDDLNINRAFQEFESETQLLFFKTHDEQYLSINRTDNQGHNAVFYKKTKISNSLYEFLRKYVRDSDFLEYIIRKNNK